jgi:F-type H+-transporting ATPase subunit b
MHAPEPFWQTPEFWVAVSFAIFCGILIYVGAHRKIIAALDQRSARIKAELDDARRLRDEAAQLLAEYQGKQRDAEREAAGIIAGAKAEAERLAAEARTKMEEFVARRTQMAETKITQAEAQAIADVRSAAAEAAVAAAEKVLTQTVKGKVADELLTKGIADAAKKLNLN